MQPFIYAYVATAHLVRQRAEALRNNDRGQGAAEYLGMVLVVAATIGVLAASNIGDQIATYIGKAVKQVFNAGK